MICYRVVRRKYDDLSGQGARIFGGRYNPPGIPAVYSSESISLAVLEVLVHLDKTEIPRDYIVIAIRFPGAAVFRPKSREMSHAGTLSPKHFKATFYDRPVLRVASVVVPREYNYVLFPEADGFSAEVQWTEPLDFDNRLLASQGQ